MRRRGAALRLVVLDGGAVPRFFVPPLFRASALMLCPHAPTRTHDFSRVPMGSHLTPIARV